MTDPSPPPGLEELMRLHVECLNVQRAALGGRADMSHCHRTEQRFCAALTRALTDKEVMPHQPDSRRPDNATPPATAVSAPGAGALQTLKHKIDFRLNERLVGLPEGYDDSVVGFNLAWEIVTQAFTDFAPSGDGPEAQPLSAPVWEPGPGNTVEAAPDYAAMGRACEAAGFARFGEMFGKPEILMESPRDELEAALTLARQRIAELEEGLRAVETELLSAKHTNYLSSAGKRILAMVGALLAPAATKGEES